MQKRKDDRERNRERKARGNRKYGQAKLKHAKRGVLSSGIAALVGVLLVTMVVIAYTSGGTAGSYIGGLGVVSAIFAGVGIYLGFRGFREREKDYLTCKIGIGCNIFFLVGFIGIFCRGLF